MLNNFEMTTSEKNSSFIHKKFFQKLNNQIIGLETQKNKIETALKNFQQSGKGGSIVLSGRRGSGKSLLLNKILKEMFNEDQIIYEDGDVYTNSIQPLKSLSDLGLIDENSSIKKKDDKLYVIIIDHVEYFTSKKSQNFLYTLLNGTHQFSWFVIIIGISQDCVLVPPLEKRVYSRLSKSIISFNYKYTNKQMFDAFYHFTDSFSDCSDEDFKNLNLRESTNTELHFILNNFFDQCQNYSLVKKLVLLFIVVFQLKKKKESLNKILRFCTNSICPEDEILPILKELPLRQLCLLQCFIILEKTERKYEFICRNIILEYKRFLNIKNAQMLYVDDAGLYKDIEELIAMDAITLKGGADIGELQFRKVSINVEAEAIYKCFMDRRHLPIEVSKWLQPYSHII